MGNKIKKRRNVVQLCKRPSILLRLGHMGLGLGGWYFFEQVVVWLWLFFGWLKAPFPHSPIPPSPHLCPHYTPLPFPRPNVPPTPNLSLIPILPHTYNESNAKKSSKAQFLKCPHSFFFVNYHSHHRSLLFPHTPFTIPTLNSLLPRTKPLLQ